MRPAFHPARNIFLHVKMQPGRSRFPAALRRAECAALPVGRSARPVLTTARRTTTVWHHRGIANYRRPRCRAAVLEMHRPFGSEGRFRCIPLPASPLGLTAPKTALMDKRSAASHFHSIKTTMMAAASPMLAFP
ncbi:hypothetical protein AAFF_G00236400 [Aldrovandia affinis]|uniref:Uncharacterized protein n=1 Tax=Aldrovandia affinis TaxID=143900 RepID=A0AAD7REY9_9TELE|nr:hypothetical protein AAFF_G00236400 [Aldrovandia affinis]